MHTASQQTEVRARINVAYSLYPESLMRFLVKDAFVRMKRIVPEFLRVTGSNIHAILLSLSSFFFALRACTSDSGMQM